MLSAEASCLFDRSQHLIQSSGLARLCEKKYNPSAARCGDFFSANPKGKSCPAQGIVRKFWLKKVRG
ncbi:hypothetical protein CPT03_08410 [Pedobacter ginsengisoli]|uniref:Uncharacterized protein n=1 Tax=Pedobacter ginsengisoli TaxID=363852 RepID=A0A2D1U4F6_9SPHI|nr:hypothetical protein CPT03_08410 [Pedobacter ginsengisoli]